MLPRRLEPELLDELDANDPAAIASRRDLARINLVMLQHRLMARTLRTLPPPRLLLDLGGGDGRFLLGVAKRLPQWKNLTAVIADRQDILGKDTSAGFAKLGWRCEVRQGDVFDTLETLREDNVLVTANLFLHHLDDAALTRLFALIAARTHGVAACEPRRNRFALAASHLVFALGCNAVTRHDAVASVRAGFIADELTRLWPPGWRLAEQAAFPFSHLFTAQRDV